MQKDATQEVCQDVLVIGGGVAGLQVCHRLAELGLKSCLVEKTASLGGQLTRLHSLLPLELNPPIWLQNMIAAVQDSKSVEIFSKAQVASLEGHFGNFRATIQQGSRVNERKFGAIAIAIGQQVRHPKQDKDTNLGRQPLSVLEFEDLLHRSRPEQLPRRICFLLDFGQLTPTPASAAALRQSCLSAERGAEVYLASRELNLLENGFEKLYRRAREAGVVFFKYAEGPKLKAEGNGVILELTDRSVGVSSSLSKIRLEADCLVMPGRFLPSEDNEALASLLEVELDSQGFFQPADVRMLPAYTNRRGIFVLGSCRGAATIQEILRETEAVCSEIYQLIATGTITIDWPVGQVDEEKCTFCLSCYRCCPHRAVILNPDAEAADISPLACYGCGICAAECPAQAIQIEGFSDEDILAEIGSPLAGASH